jgi:hypothetical protein
VIDNNDLNFSKMATLKVEKFGYYDIPNEPIKEKLFVTDGQLQSRHLANSFDFGHLTPHFRLRGSELDSKRTTTSF